VKCKTCQRKNEEKGEFGSPRNESLYFKQGTPIMLGLDLWMLEYVHDILHLSLIFWKLINNLWLKFD
jgi:hypothetical protein